MKKLLISIFCFLSVYASAQTKVTAPIVRNNPADTYPTHFDSLGRGGMIVFSTLSERDALPTSQRKIGMLAGVGTHIYQLRGTLANSGWKDINNSTCNSGLISGSVVHDINFDFDNTYILFELACTQYDVPAGSFTINPSGSQDRYTIVVVDTFHHIFTKDGPSGPAAIPSVTNPGAELAIATYFIPAFSTTPQAVSDEVVFQEGVEWVPSSNVVGALFDYTTNPYRGTYSTFIPTTATGNIQYLGPDILKSPLSYLVLHIKLNAVLGSGRFEISLLSDGSAVSNSIILSDGLYGLDGSNTTDYQTVAVAASAWSFQPATTINTLYINLVNTPQFQLDNIYFQSGGSNVDVPFIMPPIIDSVGISPDTSLYIGIDKKTKQAVATWATFLTYNVEGYLIDFEALPNRTNKINVDTAGLRTWIGTLGISGTDSLAYHTIVQGAGNYVLFPKLKTGSVPDTLYLDNGGVGGSGGSQDLQSVLSIGNTALIPINLTDAAFSSASSNTQNIAAIYANNTESYLVLQTGGLKGYIRSGNLSGSDRDIELPNIDGTLAEGITDGSTTVHADQFGIIDISSLLIGGGSTPNLQQVTDIDSVTTHDLILHGDVYLGARVGTNNLFFGANSGAYITDGAYNNIGIGIYTLSAIDNSGYGNIAIGNQTLSSSIGYNNIGIGTGVMSAELIGNNNTVVGSHSYDTHEGEFNTILGSGIGEGMTTSGDYNTIVGAVATGSNLITGSNNTIIGAQLSQNFPSGDISDYVVIGSRDTVRLIFNNDGMLSLPDYVGATFVGTPAYSLGVDASGNVIKFTGGGSTPNLQAVTDVDNHTTNPIFSSTGFVSVGTGYQSLIASNAAGDNYTEIVFDNATGFSGIRWIVGGTATANLMADNAVANNYQLPSRDGTLALSITDGSTTVDAGTDGIIDISSMLTKFGEGDNLLSANRSVNLSTYDFTISGSDGSFDVRQENASYASYIDITATGLAIMSRNIAATLASQVQLNGTSGDVSLISSTGTTIIQNENLGRQVFTRTNTTDSYVPRTINGILADLDGEVTLGLEEYIDNADAIANGKTAGYIYRTGDLLKIVH